MTTLHENQLIFPDWPAPANVRTLQTTRLGGHSLPPYDTLNLGDHVADDPITVAANRQLLNRFVPTEPLWLAQVHSTIAVDAAQTSCLPQADASYSRNAGVVCAVMTADCLPVLLCDQAGSQVAAIHAGWKGLLDGVIEATIDAMGIASPASNPMLAWLGPAIGPQVFEVGDEVRSAFIARDAAAASAFAAHGEGKWLGDIYALARQRLASKGITAVYGGGLCTYSDPERFFSFRRDGATGRMASLIWLD